MNAQNTTTPAIDTLTPAIRQRKGDYVQGPDSDTGEWRIGRIIDKVAGGLVITGGFTIPKDHAYKLTREAFEKVEMEKKRVRIHPDWSRYTRHTGIATRSGKVVIDINDYVAGILRGLDLDDAYDIVARYIRFCHATDETAIDAKDLETLDTADKLRAKYSHLNPGMQRMALGNRLRGAMSRAGIDTLPSI